MRRYFGRKLLTYAITFFIAATIDWLIPRLMPGDPIAGLMQRTGGGSTLSPEASAAMVQYYTNLFGLNRPMWEQYLGFWTSLFHGDLGLSIFGHGRAVTDTIMAAVPYTLGLLIPAILLSWWVGNTVGALEDFRGCLALDPKMAAAKTRIAALESSSVPGTSPVGQPIPSRKEVSSAGAGVNEED